MSKRKKAGSGGPAAAIGGLLAGFDHQIFRTPPPPHELVLKARPVRGLSGEGGDLEITFPDDAEGPREPDRSAGADAAGSVGAAGPVGAAGADAAGAGAAGAAAAAEDRATPLPQPRSEPEP